MEDWGKYSDVVSGEYYVWDGIEGDATQPTPWPTEFDAPVRRLSSPREAVLGRAMEHFLAGSPGLDLKHVRNRMRAITVPPIRVIDLRNSPLNFGEDALTRAVVRAARKAPGFSGIAFDSSDGGGETAAIWRLDGRRPRKTAAPPAASAAEPSSELVASLMLQGTRLSREIDLYARRLFHQESDCPDAALAAGFRDDLAKVEWMHQDAASATHFSPGLFSFVRRVLRQLEIEHAALALRSDEPTLRFHHSDRLPRRRRRTAVPTLLDLSHDEDPLTQEAAAHALADLGDAAAQDRVREMFETGSPAIRCALLTPDGSLARDGEALEDATRDAEALVRRAAIEALGRRHSLNRGDGLAVGLRDPEPIVRSAALSALDPKDPGIHSHLLQAVHDPSELVRRLAVMQLRKARPEGALEALKAARDDSDSKVRLEVARTLQLIGGPDATRSLLFMLFHDESAEVQRAASLSLSYICHPEALKIMVDRLAERDQLTERLLPSFTRRTEERALAAMTALLSAPDFPQGRTALTRLVKRANADEVLRTLLEAVEAEQLPLSMFNRLVNRLKPSVDLLIEAIMSPSSPVRVAAVTACAKSRLAPQRKIEVLLYASTSEDRQVKLAVWKALCRKSGRGGRKKVLRKLARGNSHLADLATDALEGLELGNSALSR